METAAREQLAKASRVVVKVGTHTLASVSGRPITSRMRAIAKDINWLRGQGKEVVLVSSGAVGMGLAALKRDSMSRRLSDLQMAAAVGQTRLMNRYQELFSKHGVVVGQVLLTSDDLHHRRRHLNARATLRKLIDNDVLPIVNENDTVSVDEIKMGDNDLLAAQVALLVDADALVLLTTVDGLRSYETTRSKRIPYLKKITKEELDHVSPSKGVLSSGGMRSKLEAAKQLVRAGRLVVIADGRKQEVLRNIFSGTEVGTLIGSEREADLKQSRKRWLAYSPRTKGVLEVDAGAAKALREKGRSLLPVGVTAVRGSFDAGALVSIFAARGKELARGLVSYSSAEIAVIKGRKTSEIEKILGARQFDEVVHRDNLVLVEES